MKKILMLLFVLVCGGVILSPLPVSALVTVSPTPVPKAADGTNKKKSRKKLVKKTSAVVPKVPINMPALVDIYIAVEGNQSIVNIYNQMLFTQNMQQTGDTITMLGKQNSTPSPDEDLKDRQLAETIVKELKTKGAFFMRSPGTKNSAEKNTIALNKDKWTEADVIALQKIISEKYAPNPVSFLPVAISKMKELVLPGTLAAEPAKPEIKPVTKQDQ